MIEIIKIEYREKFVKVELNSGESLRISILSPVMSRFKKGDIIESPAYDILKEESYAFECMEKSISYLAIRARTIFEMERYLSKKGFRSGIIKTTLEKLKNSGYLNDYDYAVTYARNKLEKKAVGKRLVSKELSARGIKREMISSVMKDESITAQDMEKIYKAAVKKLESVKSKQNKKQKLVFFLQSRGFEWDEIRTTINRLKKENLLNDEADQTLSMTDNDSM